MRLSSFRVIGIFRLQNVFLPVLNLFREDGLTLLLFSYLFFKNQRACDSAST